MKISVVTFILTATILGIMVSMSQGTPVNETSVQPTMSSTPNSEQQHHVSMTTYTAMVRKIIHVQQLMGQLLTEQSSSHTAINYTAAQADRFDYCFLKDVANPPSKNLTVRI